MRLDLAIFFAEIMALPILISVFQNLIARIFGLFLGPTLSSKRSLLVFPTFPVIRKKTDTEIFERHLYYSTVQLIVCAVVLVVGFVWIAFL